MWFILTALQLQGAVLCVKRETAEVHGAKCCDSDPGSTANTGEGTATSFSETFRKADTWKHCRGILVKFTQTSEPWNTLVIIHVNCSGSCGDRRPPGTRLSTSACEMDMMTRVWRLMSHSLISRWRWWLGIAMAAECFTSQWLYIVAMTVLENLNDDQD